MGHLGRRQAPCYCGCCSRDHVEPYRSQQLGSGLEDQWGAFHSEILWFLETGGLQFKLQPRIPTPEFRHSCSHLLGKFKAIFQAKFRPKPSTYFFPRSSLYESFAEYPVWPPGVGISDLPSLTNILDGNFSGGQSETKADQHIGALVLLFGRFTWLLSRVSSAPIFPKHSSICWLYQKHMGQSVFSESNNCYKRRYVEALCHSETLRKVRGFYYCYNLLKVTVQQSHFEIRLLQILLGISVR